MLEGARKRVGARTFAEGGRGGAGEAFLEPLPGAGEADRLATMAMTAFEGPKSRLIQ